jgi:hypothetical protein
MQLDKVCPELHLLQQQPIPTCNIGQFTEINTVTMTVSILA